MARKREPQTIEELRKLLVAMLPEGWSLSIMVWLSDWHRPGHRSQSDTITVIFRDPAENSHQQPEQYSPAAAAKHALGAMHRLQEEELRHAIAGASPRMLGHESRPRRLAGPSQSLSQGG